MKMIIMRGLPASGKSTEAEKLTQQGQTVRLNKDLLRTMLHYDKFNGINEGRTQEAQRTLAKNFLELGLNVIIDDTNLNPNTVDSWKNLAKEVGAKIEYVDMTHVPVHECVKRDLVRKYRGERHVGETVIFKMALQYLDFWKGEKTVVCDLDGTLCDTEHRLHFVRGEKKDWKGFFEAMGDDPIRTETVDKLLKYDKTHKIIFVSARPEKYRDTTELWLERKLNGYRIHGALIMRSDNDKRPDTEVKSEIYDKYLKNLDIELVIDDRPSVIRMWREKGLNVLDVGKGIEF